MATKENRALIEENHKLQAVVKELQLRNQRLEMRGSEYNQGKSAGIYDRAETANEVRRPTMREKATRDIAQAHELIESANFELQRAKDLIAYLDKNPELEKMLALLNR